MSRKRMVANVLVYSFCGIGCCLAGGVMFHHADAFLKALKEKGEN